MSRIHSEQLLLPSLLDRLIDNEPTVRSELPKERAQLLRDLKNSVRRDLENLLNTRLPLLKLPKGAAHLPSSLLNYGIPDLSGVVLESGTSMESLRQSIEQAIRSFETRFQHVRVELVIDEKTRYQRHVRFVIDGVLWAEPSPEPVRFDSMLSTVSKEFKVKDTTL